MSEVSRDNQCEHQLGGLAARLSFDRQEDALPVNHNSSIRGGLADVYITPLSALHSASTTFERNDFSSYIIRDTTAPTILKKPSCLKELRSVVLSVHGLLPELPSSLL
jgi:hypothetical protein